MAPFDYTPKVESNQLTTTEVSEPFESARVVVNDLEVDAIKLQTLDSPHLPSLTPSGLSSSVEWGPTPDGQALVPGQKGRVTYVLGSGVLGIEVGVYPGFTGAAGYLWFAIDADRDGQGGPSTEITLGTPLSLNSLSSDYLNVAGLLLQFDCHLLYAEMINEGTPQHHKGRYSQCPVFALQVHLTPASTGTPAWYTLPRTVRMIEHDGRYTKNNDIDDGGSYQSECTWNVPIVTLVTHEGLTGDGVVTGAYTLDKFRAVVAIKDGQEADRVDLHRFNFSVTALRSGVVT